MKRIHCGLNGCSGEMTEKDGIFVCPLCERKAILVKDRSGNIIVEPVSPPTKIPIERKKEEYIPRVTTMYLPWYSA